MKILNSLLMCLAVCGCMKNAAPTTQMILDNHGGYSHAGRQVTLQSDGTYSDKQYTDVVGAEKSTRGSYTFDDAKAVLTLWSSTHQAEQLVRVDVAGKQFWVHPEEKNKIINSSETRLRQAALSLDMK